MAEGTVDLPVAGPVKKQWVYVGLAGVAGIVGYAYWKRSQNAATVVEPGIEDYGGGLQTGGAGSTTPGLAYQPIDDPGDDEDRAPTTNAEWTQRAVSYLSQLNFDPQVVAIALGKYLSRLPLTPAEADIVRTATGAIGRPPVGEYQIIMVPNPPGGGGGGGGNPQPDPPTHVAAPLNRNLYDWVSSLAAQYPTLGLTFIKMFGTVKNDPTALNPSARNYMTWEGPAGSTKIPKFLRSDTPAQRIR